MSFREALEEIVKAAPGGIGAVLVDGEGEAIDLFTKGDSFETKLVGAHNGIFLGLIERAIANNGEGSSLGAVSIRSEKYTYSMVPVSDGIFVVLIQCGSGIPSKGLKILRESIPSITRLI
jgi:predicted regulator of Ras-like GTPase activity (Roadblock/LC7/MglB family)